MSKIASIEATLFCSGIRFLHFCPVAAIHKRAVKKFKEEVGKRLVHTVDSAAIRERFVSSYPGLAVDHVSVVVIDTPELFKPEALEEIRRVAIVEDSESLVIEVRDR